MIPAKDLRLDNWIYNIFDAMVQVSNIDGTANWGRSIPLTADMIVKCGWKQALEQPMIESFTTYLFQDANSHFNIRHITLSNQFYLNDELLIEIKHLHKLQNIMYEMANIEINYTP